MGRIGRIALGSLLLAGCSARDANVADANAAGNDSGNAQAEAGSAGAADDSARSVRRVSAQIDFSNSATIADQVQDLASKVTGAELVHLDLTIVPEGEDSPNYRISETPQSGPVRPLQCDSGDRLASRAFAFQFNPDYNHLLLEILHGPPDVAPFSTAACAYRGGGTVPVFVLRGYYAVSAVDIPTATDVQLRPVSPNFR